jgi:hypothetical protein
VSDGPKNDRLARALAKVTHDSNEVFENAVLDVYSDVLNAILTAAKQGLRFTVIRPSMDAAKSAAVIKAFPLTYMARIVAKLLEAEGVQAQVIQRDCIKVSWPAVPPHWETDN